MTFDLDPELSMGSVNPRVGLGWVGLDWVEVYIFGEFGWVVGPNRRKPKNYFFTFSEFIDTDGHGFGWVGPWVQIFTVVWIGLAWIGHLVG